MSVGTAATLVAIGTTAATAGAGIYGAKKASGAAKDAAAQQTAAANYAADAQAKSTADALAFQKQQAAADAAKYDAAQRANYAQYLTHYNAAKGLGAQLGVDLPTAPTYDAALGGRGTPAGQAAATGTGPGTAPPAPTGGLASPISAYVPGGGAPAAPPVPGAPTPAGGASATVTIRTPDGRVLQGFPQAKVAEALQRGAQVVP